MLYKSQSFDYEPLKRRRAVSGPQAREGEEEEDNPFAVTPRAARPAPPAESAQEEQQGWSTNSKDAPDITESDAPSPALKIEEDEWELPRRPAARERASGKERWFVRRGHTLSFVGLFLFTVLLYFRPYELSVSLSFLLTAAYWVALCTLVVFVPTQLVLEGNLTARPREINLVLLFTLAGLLSVPLAIDAVESWNRFFEFLKVVLMFVVMVNVVRTERRLKLLVLVSLTVGCVVSIGAVNDYRQGNLKVGGERVAGIIGGLLQNPNEMALFLVMMTPIAIGMLLGTRGLLRKALYAVSAIVMAVAIVITFSRGGFLGLACALGVLLWKVGRRHRLSVALMALIVCAALVVLMPGMMVERFASIFNMNSELNGAGSAYSRRDLLLKSIVVALRHPLLGIGMGNFHNYSYQNQVTHNSYTQVASEMGLPALVVYFLFNIAPLKRLRQIEREVFGARHGSRFYYLAIGFEASIIGYMVSSFFDSVAYQYYLYYLMGYAICLHRMYELTRDRVTEEHGTKATIETQADGIRGNGPVALEAQPGAFRSSS